MDVRFAPRQCARAGWGVVGFLRGRSSAFQRAFQVLKFDWAPGYLISAPAALHTSAGDLRLRRQFARRPASYIVQGLRRAGSGAAGSPVSCSGLPACSFLMSCHRLTCFGGRPEARNTLSGMVTDLWLRIVWVAFWRSYMVTRMSVRNGHLRRQTGSAVFHLSSWRCAWLVQQPAFPAVDLRARGSVPLMSGVHRPP